MCSPSAGIASAMRTPAGERRPRPAGAPARGRGSSPRHRWRRAPGAVAPLARNGTRPFSTRSPSQRQHAGRTVTEPSIATATTMIVPVREADERLEPVKNMPAIATITVRPETSTARPEVAAAASSALARLRPARPLLALAAQVEQRVVDADGEADQQDHRVDGLVTGMIWLGRATRPMRSPNGGEAEQQRDARRDQRAEGDHQDDQRDRDRGDLGLGEVVRERLVERLARAGASRTPRSAAQDARAPPWPRRPRSGRCAAWPGRSHPRPRRSPGPSARPWRSAPGCAGRAAT